VIDLSRPLEIEFMSAIVAVGCFGTLPASDKLLVELQ
jgi:hypothetical protein